MPELLDGTLFGREQPCFGCGPAHPIGFRLQFAIEGPETVARFTPNDLHQGPPGVMHGGLVSTLIDEVGAWAVIAHRRKFGFTTSLACRFHRAVRIGPEITCRAEIKKETSRLMDVSVQVHQSGELAASGELRFVILGRAAAEKLIGQTLPPEWQVFTR